MLNHIRTGRGGETVVLVHGFLGGSGYWLPVINHLAPSFDVIAVDLPGFAGSADAECAESISEFGGAIIELLDSLGVGRFAIVGHSMGGMIVVQMALDHGERITRLVPYGTSPSGDVPNRFASFEALMERMARDGIARVGEQATVRSWFVAGVEHPYYPLCLAAGAGASTPAGLKAVQAVLDWDARDRLGEITVPTQIIVGDRDVNMPPAEAFALWRGISGARLAVMPGCAHNAHLEKPDIFNRILAGFLHGQG